MEDRHYTVNMQPLEDLPFRDLSADSEVKRLMAERGETLADVVWFSDSCYERAADFTVGVLLTKKSVYTVVKDWWYGEDAYYPRVFVSDIGKETP